MRSLLFAPANHPRRVEKALASDADAAILDLEDAVPEAEKLAARGALAAAAALPRRTRFYVRINALSSYHGVADLPALPANLDGIVIPKCESAAEIGQVAAFAPKLDLLPIIETARGLAAAGEIARASPRVRRLAFGALDFALDLGLSPGRDEAELAPYRAQLVLASRLADRERYLAHEVRGSRYNLGTTYGLLTAQLALGLAGKDRAEILAQLVELLARQPQ